METPVSEVSDNWPAEVAREAPHAAVWSGWIRHKEDFCFDGSKIAFPLLHVWLIFSVLYLHFLGIAIT